MSNAFTPEQIAWLREHAPGTYFAPLTDEFNRVFGQSRSQAAIVSACFYRGFGNGLKSKNLEDLEVKGKKYRFKPGYVPPNKGVKGYVTDDPRKLANMQKTQFKKGQRATNYLPVGSIRYTAKSGCLIKVQDNGIKVYFTKLNKLQQQILIDLSFELGIAGARSYTELSRTHWAIKRINLIEVLEKAGYRVFKL